MGFFSFVTAPFRYMANTATTMYEGGREMVHAHNIWEFSHGFGQMLGAPVIIGADVAIEAATGVPNVASAATDASGLNPLDYFNNYRRGINYIGGVLRGHNPLPDVEGAAERAAVDIAAGYVGRGVGSRVGGGEAGEFVARGATEAGVQAGYDAARGDERVLTHHIASDGRSQPTTEQYHAHNSSASTRMMDDLREMAGRFQDHSASDEDLGHAFLHYSIGPGSTTSAAEYDVTDAPEGAQYNVAAAAA
jgi:hypothetical protein